MRERLHYFATYWLTTLALLLCGAVSAQVSLPASSISSNLTDYGYYAAGVDLQVTGTLIASNAAARTQSVSLWNSCSGLESPLVFAASDPGQIDFSGAIAAADQGPHCIIVIGAFLDPDDCPNCSRAEGKSTVSSSGAKTALDYVGTGEIHLNFMQAGQQPVSLSIAGQAATSWPYSVPYPITTTVATNPGATITRVEFYERTPAAVIGFADPFEVRKVGEATAAPFGLSPLPAHGQVHFFAIATDSRGHRQRSNLLGGFFVWDNTRPTLTVVEPVVNQTYSAPANINISAFASDAESYVQSFKVFNGANATNPLTTITRSAASSAPFTYTWTNVGPGTYNLFFEAADTLNIVRRVGPVPVTVTNASPKVQISAPIGDGAHLNGGVATTVTATITDERLSTTVLPSFVFTVPNFGSSTLTGSAPVETAPGSGIWTSSVSYVPPTSNNAQLNYGGNSTVQVTVTDQLGQAATSEARRYVVVNSVYDPSAFVKILDPLPGASVRSGYGVTYAACAADRGLNNASQTIALVKFYRGTTWLANSGSGVDNSTLCPFGKLYTATANFPTVLLGPATIRADAFVSTVASNPLGSSPLVSVTVVSNLPPRTAPALSNGLTTLTLPVSGLSVLANASDLDGTVASIEYWLNGVKQSAAAAQASLSWTPTEVGTYSWVVKVKDASNLETVSAPLVVTVNPVAGNVAPTVNLVSPINGLVVEAVNGAMNLVAQASDTAPGTVDRVEFFDGNSKIPGTVTRSGNMFTLVWTQIAEGPHRLTARAVDSQGSVTVSAAISVMVAAGQPPVVSIVSPTASDLLTAPENIEIMVSATDDFGVTKVEFFDGAVKIGEDTSAPFSYSYQNVPAGTHALRAVAWDAALNSMSSATVSVVVRVNQAPTISLTSLVGQTFLEGANVPLAVTVTDPDEPAAVNEMEVRYYRAAAMDDANEIGRSTYFPYRSTWLNVPYGNGTQQVWAKVKDRRGAWSSAATTTFNVTQNAAPNSFSLSAPCSGQCPIFLTQEAILMAATATDPNQAMGDRVASMAFYAQPVGGGVALQIGETDTTTPFAATILAGQLAAGDYNLYAIAADTRGLTRQSSSLLIKVRANTAPKTVLLTKPAMPNFYRPIATSELVPPLVLQAGGVIALEAEVVDAEDNIQRVDFALNGSVIASAFKNTIGQTRFSASYTLPSAAAAGQISVITARAIDTRNLSTAADLHLQPGDSGYFQCGGDLSACMQRATPIAVTLGQASTPCGGSGPVCDGNQLQPIRHNAVIRGERFDQGGNGVGYFELKSNGLNIRGEQNEIGGCLALGEEGCFLSGVDAGEWTRYSVSIAEADQGAYNYRLREFRDPPAARIEAPYDGQLVKRASSTSDPSVVIRVKVAGNKLANVVSTTEFWARKAELTNWLPIGTDSNWNPQVSWRPSSQGAYKIRVRSKWTIPGSGGNTEVVGPWHEITVNSVDVLPAGADSYPTEIQAVEPDADGDIKLELGSSDVSRSAALKPINEALASCDTYEITILDDNYYDIFMGCPITLAAGDYYMTIQSPVDGFGIDQWTWLLAGSGTTLPTTEIVQPVTGSSHPRYGLVPVLVNVNGALANQTDVEFNANGTTFATLEDASAPFTANFLADQVGTVAINARARVGSGEWGPYSSSPAIITVVAANGAPSASISKPTGSVLINSMVDLEATAVDADGSLNDASAQFVIKDASSAVVATLPATKVLLGGGYRYVQTWLAPATAGSYSVTFSILDNAGLTGSSVKTFDVTNGGAGLALEDPAVIPGSISPESDGVGATAGQFRVDEGGSATYSIPILTPPGRAGVMPSVALNYSSQGGMGPYGKGWSLSGASGITRCRPTFEDGDAEAATTLDGQLMSSGSPPIRFNNSDRFCLDGQKLILVMRSGDGSQRPYGSDGAEYRTQIDQYARIRSYGTGPNGPRYFVVERKDGSLAWYGGEINGDAIVQLSNGFTTISRPDAYLQRNQNAGVANPVAPAPFSQPALTWALARTMDSKGNYIDYVYDKDDARGQQLLSRIDYTGKTPLLNQPGAVASAPFASIEFRYDASIQANLVRESYQLGMLSRQEKQLSSIASYTDGKLLREYELTQTLSASGSNDYLLRSIKECAPVDPSAPKGDRVCYAPTQFAWAEQTTTLPAEQKITWTTSMLMPFDTDNHRLSRLGDVDGDGIQDLVWWGKNRGGEQYDTGTCAAGSAIRVLYGSSVTNVDGSKRFEFVDVPQKSFCVLESIPRDKIESLLNLIDFDGDGAEDVMIGDFVDGAETSGRWHIFRSTGKRTRLDDGDTSNDVAFDRATDLLPACGTDLDAGNCLPISKNGALIQLADFNGDSLQDALYGIDGGAGLDALRIRLQERTDAVGVNPGGAAATGLLGHQFGKAFRVTFDWSESVAAYQYCGYPIGATIPSDGINGTIPTSQTFVTCTLNLRTARDERIPGPSVTDLDGDGHADLFATIKHVKTQYVPTPPSPHSCQPQRTTESLTSLSDGNVSYGNVPYGDWTTPVGSNANQASENQSFQVLAAAYAGSPNPQLWPCRGGEVVSDVHSGFRLSFIGTENNERIARFDQTNVFSGAERGLPAGDPNFTVTPDSNALDKPRLVDMNGDGLQDLLFLEYGPVESESSGRGNILSVLNLGGRFQQIGEASVSTAVGARKFTEFADINADGLPDLVHPGGLTGANNMFKVRLTKANGRLGQAAEMTESLIEANDAANWTRYFTDMDGDGVLDYVAIQMAHSNGGGAGGSGATSNNFATSRAAARTATGGTRYRARDVLTGFTNGLGANTKISYEPLTNNAVYRRGSGARGVRSGLWSPRHDLLGAIYVVSKVESDAPTQANANGRAALYYQYADARMQGGGRGYLGFGEIRTIDANFANQHVVTISKYRQTFPLVGMPLETSKFLVNAAYVESDCIKGNGPEATPGCFAASVGAANTFFGTSQFSRLISYAWNEHDFVENYPNVFFPFVRASYEATGNPEGGDYETIGTTINFLTYNLAASTLNELPTRGNLLKGDQFLIAGGSFGSLSALAAHASATLADANSVCAQNQCVTRVTTDSTYADRTGIWRLARLSTSTVTHQRYENGVPLSTNSVRKTAFTYDTDNSGDLSGLLLSQTLQPDGPADQYLRTVNQYDAYGNITMAMTCSKSVVDAGNCNVLTGVNMVLQRPAEANGAPLNYIHRYTKTEFDAAGRFPVATRVPYYSGTDANFQRNEQESSRVLDRDALGNPLATEDANGVITTASYGPMGRAQMAHGADDSASANEFHWCTGFQPSQNLQHAACPSGAVFRQTSYAYGGARSVAYFDKLGRKFLGMGELINSDVDSATNNDWSASCSGFDGRGRAESVSNPFFVSASVNGLLPSMSTAPSCASRPSTRTEYDYLDRVVKIRLPEDFTAEGPANTVTSYDGLTTTTTFAFKRGNQVQTQTKVEQKDASGLVRWVDDHYGFRTHYTYDNTNNLTKVTRTVPGRSEIVSTISYDTLGRKIAQQDPDAGSIKYLYNAAGEQICSEDARGMITVTDYDTLGRVWRKRSEPDRCPESGSTAAVTLAASVGVSAPATGASRISEMTWYDIVINASETDGNPQTEALGAARKSARYQTVGANYAQLDLMTKVSDFDLLRRPKVTYTRFAYNNTNEAYVESLTYDSLGRVATTTDATGGRIENMYSSHGFLRRVRDANQPSLLYFEALLGNERGQLVRERKHGNNAITTERGFNPTDGKLVSIRTGTLQGSSVVPVQQDLQYTWDVQGNLVHRADVLQNLNERFTYDALNRLLTGHVSQNGGAEQTSISLSYDALGNICSKNLESYFYAGQSGCGQSTHDSGTTSPHAVTKRTTDSFNSIEYKYDLSGNQTHATNTDVGLANQNRIIRFGAEGLADRVVVGPGTSSESTSDFRYGGSGRYLRTDVENGTTTVTRYLAGVEWVTKTNGASVVVEKKRYIGGFLILTQTGSGSLTYRYQLGDHLGSVDTLIDETGQVIERMSFNAHGERRKSNGTGVWVTLEQNYRSSNTTHGFTGHEHIDHANIVHMNGRLYDASLGRMLSVDPIVQDLYNVQNLNRYTYVLNNPLSLTDPSGLSWLSNNWRMVAAAVITIAVAILVPGSWQVMAKFFVAVTAGAAAGGIASASTKGALTGAISAAIFFGIGEYYNGLKDASGNLSAPLRMQKVLAHGIAGGVMSKLSGGKFGNGFFAAGLTQLLAPGIDKVGGDDWLGAAQRVLLAGLVGGTSSLISGGKFGNGALTAMFSRAFNDELSKVVSRKQVISAIDQGKLTSVDAIVLHRTDGATADSAIEQWKQGGAGAHFIVDSNGDIIQTAETDTKTYHVGKVRSRCVEEGACVRGKWNPAGTHDSEKVKAYPDRYPINADSLGIEVVGKFDPATNAFEPPTQAQLDAVKKLIEALQVDFSLGDSDIYRHGDISYKQEDEGKGLGY